MNRSSLILVKLIINCIYIAGAQNATHGNLSYAFDKCRKSGGFAPRDIINLLPLGKLQVENCAVAKSLVLDDGESLWTHYRAELGAYIAPFSCAKKLPTAFKESVNSNNMLFECSNLCSRKQPKIQYIGIQNEECYCLEDQGTFSIQNCHNKSISNSATVAYVYELTRITVEKETYACITSVLLNNSRIYDAAKCSEKHLGLCTSDKRNGFEAEQQNCLNYKDTFDSIGRSFCILNITMFKDDIDQACSALSAEMPLKSLEGIDRYLAFSESFYFSSVRTFRIVDNAKFTFGNSTLTCVSLYKRGCTIILEPDRCQNVNRFQCQYSSISIEQTGRNMTNHTDTLIAILIPSALLLILAICFVVRFKYVKRTRKSADVCIQNVNPETSEQEHVSAGIYDYATTLSVAVSPTRRKSMYIVSQDIILNEPINTYHSPEKDSTICLTENNEYDVTTTSGRGTLQPNMTKVFTCNHVHLGIDAGEYDHIRPYAEPTVTRK